jgi:hypothetical protein
VSIVQYLVPITESSSGDVLLTAAVSVRHNAVPMRELLAAGNAAKHAANAAGFTGPGRTIHVGRAVRLV